MKRRFMGIYTWWQVSLAVFNYYLFGGGGGGGGGSGLVNLLTCC